MVRKHKLKEIKEDFKLMGFHKTNSFQDLTIKEKDLLRSLLSITNYTKPKYSKCSRLKSFYNQLKE